MSKDSQWLDLGLQDQPAALADRVRLFRMIVLASSLLRQRLDQQLAPSGITTQQGAMLQWIEAQPAPPWISAVARGMGMTHQNVKQIASALERKGFLEIVVDAEDRRARCLMITGRHRRFWKRRNPGDFSAVATWTDSLTDAEVRQGVVLLRRLCAPLRDASTP